MSKDDAPVGVTEESFSLDDWIESGTVARRQVVIHNNPALVEEFEALEARLTALGDAPDADPEADGPLSASDPHEAERAEIHAALENVYERWESSKATWTVRALSHEDVEATFDAVPVPKRPVPPLEKAGQKAQEKFAAEVSTYQAKVNKADVERRLHMIAASVVGVETAQGSVDSVTVDQVRALRDRPHGTKWVDKLYEAMSAATEGDVEVPRPTSPGRSTSDLG